MKLYIWDGREKRYLDVVAPTRNDLAQRIGSYWFTVGSTTYHVDDVRAEAGGGSSTAAGAGIGALIGLLGGPLGLIAGGIIGGAIGNNNDEGEKANVNRFNNS
jgi:hypothetical protein